jgi:hypothetical protein
VTGPWAVLGIEPTDDKRAIKRAYAAKLKATDVEADPKAFIALREALNHATWESDYIDEYYGQNDDADDGQVALAEPDADTIADPIAPDLSPISDAEIDAHLTHQQQRERAVLGYIPGVDDVAPEKPDPVLNPSAEQTDSDETENVDDDQDYDEDPASWRWEPERQPASHALQEQIIGLLWGDRPADDIAPELAEATHTILTMAEMEQIDHAAGIEDWMASIIAQSIPRSDPMTRLAVPHFGWNQTADDWRQRYDIGHAVARLADIEAIDRLERADHRWHDAWELLKGPPPDAYGWKAASRHRESIIALLQSIRHHSPGLESSLNGDHVKVWEATASGPVQTSSGSGSGWNFRWWWWVLIALYAFVQIARFAGDTAPDPSTLPSSPSDNTVSMPEIGLPPKPPEIGNISAIEEALKAARDRNLETQDYVPEVTVGTGGTDESSATDCKTVNGDVVCTPRAPPPVNRP